MSLVATPLVVMTVIATSAVCAAAIVAPLARGRASLRHLFWQCALVASVVSAVAVSSPLRPSIAVPILRARAPRAVTSLALSVPVGVRATAASRRDRASLVALLWLGGFLWVAVRYTRALSYASALRRRAASGDAARWARIVAAARDRIGYCGPLDILVSREIDVPVVTGLWRPAILLPVAASEWSESDAQLVCLHEIAHVERGDHIGRALGTLAVALHWFNPLVWWLSARATADSELAADEAVLSSGVRSTDYAEMLISVAERTVWRPAVIPGVALVGRALLSTRVHAILAVPRRRAAIGRRNRRMATVAVAFIAALMAGPRIRLVAAHEAPSVPSALRHGASRAERSTARAFPAPTSPSLVSDHRRTLATRAHSPVKQVPSEPDETWTTRAVVGLTQALDDPSPQVRAAAARSLSRLGAGGG